MSVEEGQLLPGQLLLFVPKGRFGGFSFGSKSLERLSSQKIDALTRASSRGKTAAQGEPGDSSLPIRSYSLGGGAALVVHPALSASTFSQRLEPAVYHDGAQLACVFMGHLENLGELATRYDCTSEEGLPPSPTSVMGGDPRQLAAACIAAMYHKERSGDLIVLLSELQGQFTFVLFDGAGRQVFAARDSRADSSPLFYESAEDGALTLASAPITMPSHVGLTHWAELPPGHLLAGRPGAPRLAQFALTPEQLVARESLEYSLEDELSSPRAGTGHGSSSLGGSAAGDASKLATLDLEDEGLLLGPADY